MVGIELRLLPVARPARTESSLSAATAPLLVVAAALPGELRLRAPSRQYSDPYAHAAQTHADANHHADASYPNASSILAPALYATAYLAATDV